MEDAAVLEAAGATGGGGKGTGSAGRATAVQQPRYGAAPVLGRAAEATQRLRPACGPARSSTAAAGLRPCPVIDRGDGASREAPGPRPKLVAPTASAAMEAVEEQAGKRLAEAGGQE